MSERVQVVPPGCDGESVGPLQGLTCLEGLPHFPSAVPDASRKADSGSDDMNVIMGRVPVLHGDPWGVGRKIHSGQEVFGHGRPTLGIQAFPGRQRQGAVPDGAGDRRAEPAHDGELCGQFPDSGTAHVAPYDFRCFSGIQGIREDPAEIGSSDDLRFHRRSFSSQSCPKSSIRSRTTCPRRSRTSSDSASRSVDGTFPELIAEASLWKSSTSRPSPIQASRLTAGITLGMGRPMAAWRRYSPRRIPARFRARSSHASSSGDSRTLTQCVLSRDGSLGFGPLRRRCALIMPPPSFLFPRPSALEGLSGEARVTPCSTRSTRVRTCAPSGSETTRTRRALCHKGKSRVEIQEPGNAR
ncbi:hypothetical protein SAMN02745206_02558 [Desulfacinum infernum DSM 9756]|uniref:Uncharacterized protein n=1 Tax=Desulfacinum infernum DSM 9756 TaxID=1121391 RepID=A0A1M5E163_9BACT|nr:hypothetical protein SAMN02745206_02558 [Desulfacinum infernum DSM 9756]